MPRSFSALPRRTSSCQKVLPPSMMTSPGSISFASASMVASVILPAGSITQAVRGFSSLLDEILQRLGAGRAVGGERGDRFGILVVNDRRVSVLHQPADDVAAHPAEADHAELHPDFL